MLMSRLVVNFFHFSRHCQNDHTKKEKKNHEKHYEIWLFLTFSFQVWIKGIQYPIHPKHVALCISKAFSLSLKFPTNSAQPEPKILPRKKQKQACKQFVHDPWYRRLEICKYRITRGEQGLRAKCQTLGSLQEQWSIVTGVDRCDLMHACGVPRANL